MSLEPTSFLALGGIGAAVAAGWSHIRSIFGYLRNSIVVTDTFASEISTPLMRELRTNWKVVPFGPSVYRSESFRFKDGSIHIVPFRLPPSKTMYRKGRTVIVVRGADTLSVTYLRGTIDVQELVRVAVENADVRMHDFNNKASRFCIETVIGAEKGSFGSHNGSRGRGGDYDGDAPTSSSTATAIERGGTGYENTWLDVSIDKSFMYDSSNWMYDVTEDPFQHLYYNSDIDHYIERAKRWITMGDWYRDRMIPWRLGWLLEGVGGTGKSSMALAMAQRLRIPIHQFFMSTLSDNEFMRGWNRMEGPCIALFEDFDNVFHGREAVTEHKSLSFDTVLNCISGVKNMHGIFLMISTNDISKIDPAMGVRRPKQSSMYPQTNCDVSTRPGRIDTVIHFGMMEKQARTKLASRILCDWPELIPDIVEKNNDVTPVQFQEICIQQAFKMLGESDSHVVDINARRQASS